MIKLVTNQKDLFNEMPDGIEYSTVEESLEYCSKLFYIGCDTETTGLDPYSCSILTLQLGDESTQFVIDMSTVDIENYKSLLESKDHTFIFQNAKFDLRFFLHKGIRVKNVIDTMLLECILTTGYEEGERELGLDYLLKKYLNVFVDKTIRSQIHRQGLTSKVVKYAAEDVQWLENLMNLQMKEIEKWGLSEIVKLENEVVKVFAQMEYSGLLVDKENWLEVGREVENECSEIESKLDNIVLQEPSLSRFVPKYIQGDLFSGFGEAKPEVNWNSTAQKKQVINLLGIPVDDVSSRTLHKNKRKHKIIPLLIDYSKSKKLNTSFGKKFLQEINPVSGRVHPDYWQILSTGRISVKKPNVNQIPSKGKVGPKIRKSFVAREGWKIVGGDYSGMELRIIANFSNDPVWVNAFKEGGDLHSILCSMTFDIPIENVREPFPEKPEMTYRDVQKTINFGLAYGMSEHKLADTMQIKTKEAKAIIDKFFAAVPEVSKFLKLLAYKGRTRGYIRTAKPYQRVRWFPKWEHINSKDNGFLIKGEIERASMNMPIQGTNADIIKKALVMTYNAIYDENLPVNILMSVYDEIQTECKEDYAEEWKKRLDSIMIEAAEESIKNVPIVVDCSISDYWQK